MQQQDAEYHFSGLLQSEDLNGDVTATVTKDALILDALVDQRVCLYADVRAFTVADYTLTIDTAWGTLRLTRLGDGLEWLYDKLWDAYNDVVQKALFVHGDPIYASRGEYRYEDAGGSSHGRADIRMFDSCILILPPNEQARRVPFCFVRDMKEADYALTLTLDTGEAYTFSRLGGYVEGFSYQLQNCLRAFKKKSQENIQAVYEGLNSMQLNAIARLIPQGVSAPLGALTAASPAFVQAMERQIAQSRAAEPYAYFKQICDPMEICVGIRLYEGPRGEDGTSAQDTVDIPAPEESAEDASDLESQQTDSALFIAAAKAGPAGGTAAVELAIPQEDSAATYFYKYPEDWAAFHIKLNRAMEAVQFKREVISLSEEALLQHENAYYRMAVQRTEALKFLRRCFVGRAIHSSPERWQAEANKNFQL